jgi:hypothetical protein
MSQPYVIADITQEEEEIQVPFHTRSDKQEMKKVAVDSASKRVLCIVGLNTLKGPQLAEQ